MKILNIDLKFQNPFKINTNESSKFVIKSLNTGHKLALQRNVKCFINFPINKKLLKKNNIGVTEFLAKKCKIKDNSEVMLISNNNLKVSPLTTHIDIKKVSIKINSKLIVNKVKKISWFKFNFNKKPKIGILGLNPHNAELRKNSEEKTKIVPAIKNLKN